MNIDSRFRQGKRAEQSIELNDVKINSAINEEVRKMKTLVRNIRKYNGNSLLGLTPSSGVGTC